MEQLEWWDLLNAPYRLGRSIGLKEEGGIVALDERHRNQGQVHG